MLKIKTIQSIDAGDWDELVENTYGRPYCFQQQEGCRERCIHEFTVPCEWPQDFDRDTIPEEINGEEMGVSFAAWLARDPAQQLNNSDTWAREHGLRLFWDRNFYPDFDTVVNDLFERGLIPAGEYQLVIDW